MSNTGLSPEDLAALEGFDTCTLCNAIETLCVRPRNEGYVQRGLRCMFPQLPPVAGYAVTGRMRAAAQPIHGHYYYEHIDWWRHVESLPGPRIIVLQDADDPPGAGALFGELHARICKALNCVAYVTNGAVRDLNGIAPLGFQLFAGQPSVSHAYAHVVDYGQPIEIGGLRIQSGDLLHGDVHGILSIPQAIAARLPGIAAEILRGEKSFIDTVLNGNFSIDRLAASVREHSEGQKC